MLTHMIKLCTPPLALILLSMPAYIRRLLNAILIVCRGTPIVTEACTYTTWMKM